MRLIPRVYFAALRYSKGGWALKGRKVCFDYDPADKLRPGLLDVFVYSFNLSIYWFR